MQRVCWDAVSGMIGEMRRGRTRGVVCDVKSRCGSRVRLRENNQKYEYSPIYCAHGSSSPPSTPLPLLLTSSPINSSASHRSSQSTNGSETVGRRPVASACHKVSHTHDRWGRNGVKGLPHLPTVGNEQLPEQRAPLLHLRGLQPPSGTVSICPKSAPLTKSVHSCHSRSPI